MTTIPSDMFEAEEDQNIPELQRDLQRKYRNVGSKVQELWRSFTLKQRETAMRGSVGDGKVLRNSRDPGLDGLREITPDWNLEDIVSTPHFFLDRLKFRVETDLHHQQLNGANGGPGDREIIRTVVKRQQRRMADGSGHWAMFMDVGKDYGRWMKPNGAEGMAARYPSGMMPAHEAMPFLHRQMTTYICYNHLIEEILDLGSNSRAKKTPGKKSTKDTADAMAKLTIAPKPLKASISEVIAQADEQKTASEDYLELLRSEPVVLNHAVNMINYSRPELVQDDRGRILRMFADKYLSIALFEVVSDSVKIIFTWDYIIRLVRMLDGLDDKVKRPLLIQELSNTCHLEYRRAQAAFRRQMSQNLGVAGKCFRRITAGETSRVVIKGQPSDFTVADPQLHYILRLCHPDTNHVNAAQWIQKLDDHNILHADDLKRLDDDQVFALGDLAIIVSFMHTLSTSLTMVPSSKKTGLLFTGRTIELDAELAQYKADADFGDYLVPADNLLEPDAAANALQALDDFVVGHAGTSLGSLYEDMLSGCLDDIEKKFLHVKSRLEAVDKTTYVPLPSEDPTTATVRAEQRREKAKTRPAEARVYDITAIAPRQPDVVVVPAPRLKVKTSVVAVFSTIFAKSEARGSVSWADFAAAMADMGFSVTPKGGSIYTFHAPESMGSRSITLHRPHASDIDGYRLLILSRRLNRTFRWEAETFEVD
ncbi:hypothetical protein LTR56_002321 [Elasticomyces elasticus]|nr:hypothetical protein LTR56_002321 [Elasticomyces elasticus]KAK3665885.1 hypothetical protein LTR22_003204 [Elasticomyces elasticus]KAK4929357.1 hypothetical protein LTR49_003961 [Elasticomyces elasticus]KAK5764646.1 hypothetical protein LTS12_005147 [Elasticomyces elasticus]